MDTGKQYLNIKAVLKQYVMFVFFLRQIRNIVDSSIPEVTVFLLFVK